MVSFCDGRQQFLSEEIDYLTYQHLMTPNSEAAGMFIHNAYWNGVKHGVCEHLQDQFNRGVPTKYCPGGLRNNITNTTFDPKTIQ